MQNILYYGFNSHGGYTYKIKLCARDYFNFCFLT